MKRSEMVKVLEQAIIDNLSVNRRNRFVFDASAMLGELEKAGMKPPSKGYMPTDNKIQNLNLYLNSFKWEPEDE